MESVLVFFLNELNLLSNRHFTCEVNFRAPSDPRPQIFIHFRASPVFWGREIQCHNWRCRLLSHSQMRRKEIILRFPTGLYRWRRVAGRETF